MPHGPVRGLCSKLRLNCKLTFVGLAKRPSLRYNEESPLASRLPVRRPILLLLLVSVALVAAAGRKPRTKPGANVIMQFKGATSLYNAGKYNEAAIAYQGILKAYPGHEPSRVQLAKSYYRLERLGDSFQVFQTLNPQFFDPETSYEYGQAFFAQKQWEGALYGFKKVPKGHPLFDLAGYYGAICALNLRRYQEAEDMIENAVVLPSKLVKSRDTYKKTIQELRVREEKEAIARQKSTDIQAMKDQTKQTQKDSKDKREAQAATAEAQAIPQGMDKGFVSRSSAFGLGTDIRQQTKAFGKTSTDEVTSNTNFAFVSLAVAKALNPAKVAPQAGFALTLRGENRTFRGSESPIGGSNEQFTRSLLYTAGRGDETVGSGELQAWVEGPIATTFWLGVEGLAYQAFLDFATGQAPTMVGARSWAGRRTDAFKLYGEAGYYQFKGITGQPEISWVEEVGELTLTLSRGFDLYFAGLGTQYTYPIATADGPDFDVGATTRVTVTLPFQVALGLQGSYLYSKDYRVHSLQIVDLLVYDEATLTGRAFFFWDPTPWLRLEADGRRIQRRFEKLSVGDEDVAIALESQRSNFITDTRVSATVSIPF